MISGRRTVWPCQQARRRQRVRSGASRSWTSPAPPASANRLCRTSLNGSGRVGEAARARVLEMVEQLGYRPAPRRTQHAVPPDDAAGPTSCRWASWSRRNLIMMQFMQSRPRAGAQQHHRVPWSLRTPTQRRHPQPAVGRIGGRTVLSELQPDDSAGRPAVRARDPFACSAGPGRAYRAAVGGDRQVSQPEARAVRHVIERGRYPARYRRGLRRKPYLGRGPRGRIGSAWPAAGFPATAWA